MNSLLLRNIGALTQSDRFMDSFAERVVGGQSLITPMTANVERHITTIEEKHCLGQMLQQKFLETTYHSPLATRKGEARVVPPSTCNPSEMHCDEERREKRKGGTGIHNKNITALDLHWRE